jgi:hypothetical protein
MVMTLGGGFFVEYQSYSDETSFLVRTSLVVV